MKLFFSIKCVLYKELTNNTTKSLEEGEGPLETRTGRRTTQGVPTPHPHLSRPYECDDLPPKASPCKATLAPTDTKRHPWRQHHLPTPEKATASIGYGDGLRNEGRLLMMGEASQLEMLKAYRWWGFADHAT